MVELGFRLRCFNSQACAVYRNVIATRQAPEKSLSPSKRVGQGPGEFLRELKPLGASAQRGEVCCTTLWLQQVGSHVNVINREVDRVHFITFVGLLVLSLLCFILVIALKFLVDVFTLPQLNL